MRIAKHGSSVFQTNVGDPLSEQNFFGASGMLRHGSLRFFRLLIGHCREDLKVLVVAVIEHDQKLIVSLERRPH